MIGRNAINCHFTSEFYQTIKEELALIFQKVSKRKKKKLQLIYEANVTFISKPSKDITRKETIDRNIF